MDSMVLFIAFLVVFIVILIAWLVSKRGKKEARSDEGFESGKPTEFVAPDGTAGHKDGFSAPGAVGSTHPKKGDDAKKAAKRKSSRIHVTTKASTGRPVKMSGEKTAEEADYKMLLQWEGSPSGVRECPVCGAEIANGVTVCRACGS